MSESTVAAAGSAGTQADLWKERAADWAEIMEGWNGWGIPVYRHVLERITVERGTVQDRDPMPARKRKNARQARPGSA